MPKCCACGEEKEDALFSKSQLKKGAGLAKCMACADAAAPATPTAPAPAPATPTAPTVAAPATPTAAAAGESEPGSSPAKKLCSACKQPNKVFSKNEQKKEDGKCVTCLEKEAPSSFWSGEKAQDEKQPEQPQQQQQQRKEQKQEEPQDEAAEYRYLCISCQIYKPEKSFDKLESSFCRVCWDAKTNHRQSTTMLEHGLVRSDGTSHKRLDLAPETLPEYLAYHAMLQREREQQQHHHHEEEDDDDDFHGAEYDDDEE